jgi:hypothetical protein
MNDVYKVSSIIALLVLPSLTIAQTSSFICVSDASSSYGALTKVRETSFDLPEMYLYKFALKKISTSEGRSAKWEFKYLKPYFSPTISSGSWVPLAKLGLSIYDTHFYISDGFHLQFQTRKKPIYFRMDEELGRSDMRIHLSGECQPLD